MRSLAVVLGVPVDDVTMDESLERISAFVEQGRVSGRSYQVATVNVDFVVNSCADPELVTLLQRADLAIPDGMPVVWASKLIGGPLRQRVAGADLVPELAALAASRSYSMMVFGSAEGVAEKAAEILRVNNPGLIITGFGGPFFDRVTDMSDDVLDVIRDARPDILCVALGHPKQERWIEEYRDKIDVPVLVGVGGSLDFIVGTKARAPKWMQRVGLEWTHRFATEPRRLWKRYTRDLTVFGPRVLRQLRDMGKRPPNPPRPAVVQAGDALVLRPTGSLGMPDESLMSTLSLAVGEGARVVVDMSSVRRLDHSTASSLVSLAYELNLHDAPLVLAALSTKTARSLTRLRLDRSFTLMPDMASALRPADRAEYRRQRFTAVYRPGPPRPIDRVRKPGRVTNRTDRAS
jgi:N-acetylglucosaminyldiphosphoundecaprenol N-acetyl-beta-D-mannosaminyltransferase